MQPPVSFDINLYLKLAKALCCQDEPLMALDVLSKLPAYYRDNIPTEIFSLKREIMAQMATSSFYACDVGCEIDISDEHSASMKQTLRGILVFLDVERLNQAGHIPHLIDCGSGEYWAPLVLKNANLKFTYEPSFVNWPTHNHHKRRFEDVLGKYTEGRPKIFFAGEIIEHLHDEREIRYEMEKRFGLADSVIISTPKYCFNNNVIDFKTMGTLGHLRTYTPNEFCKRVTDIFPEYSPTFYDSQILGARLVHPDTKFECLKTTYKLTE